MFCFGMKCFEHGVRLPLFAVRCSLFAVRCSLFAVRCSLFAVRCSLFENIVESEVSVCQAVLCVFCRFSAANAVGGNLFHRGEHVWGKDASFARENLALRTE